MSSMMIDARHGVAIQSQSPSPSMDSMPTSVGPEELFDSDEAMSQSYESGITLEDPEVRLAAEVLGEIHRSGSAAGSPAFLNRVSEYPILKTAVSVYEHGKTNNRGFKYAAQTIESVARPVVRHFSLDEFACRQLDKIEKRCQPQIDLESQMYAKRKHAMLENEAGVDGTRSRRPSFRWQNVISNASGLTLSLSEDSLKSLHYCVQWLQWANSHVNDLLVGLRGSVIDQESGLPRDLTEQDLSSLSSRIVHTKKEIAETLKKLVAIVSNYAGTALPEPARYRVRGFVLGMPGRLAARQGDGTSQYPLEKSQQADDIGREYKAVTTLASESLEV